MIRYADIYDIPRINELGSLLNENFRKRQTDHLRLQQIRHRQKISQVQIPQSEPLSDDTAQSALFSYGV